MSINLNLNAIHSFEDVRNALQKMKDFLDSSVLEKGNWSFFEFTSTRAVSGIKVPHQLKFIPKDILQLSVSNGATVTWEYDSFDRSNLVLSTSAACTVRAFIGRYMDGVGI